LEDQSVRFAPSGTHFLEVALARAAGRGDDTGFWLACQLRDDGLSEEEAAAIMRIYAARTPTGDHPYTEADAMRNLRSAFSGHGQSVPEEKIDGKQKKTTSPLSSSFSLSC
jgi:hypothetical protein